MSPSISSSLLLFFLSTSCTLQNSPPTTVDQTEKTSQDMQSFGTKSPRWKGRTTTNEDLFRILLFAFRSPTTPSSVLERVRKWVQKQTMSQSTHRLPSKRKEYFRFLSEIKSPVVNRANSCYGRYEVFF